MDGLQMKSISSNWMAGLGLCHNDDLKMVYKYQISLSDWMFKFLP